jgi:signal transduction histidine kinase
VERSAIELALEYFYMRTYGAQYPARVASIAAVAGVSAYFQIVSIPVAVIWWAVYVTSELVTRRWWSRVSTTLGTLSDEQALARQRQLIQFCSLTAAIAVTPFLLNLHPSQAGAIVSVIVCSAALTIIAAQHSMADEMFLWSAPLPTLALTLNIMHLAQGIDSWILGALGLFYAVNARQLQSSNTAAEIAMVKAQVDADRANQAKSTFHHAVTHIDQPIAVFDDRERLVACNQAFADLHGAKDRAKPALEGMSFTDLALWQMQSCLYAETTDEKPVDLARLTLHFHSNRDQSYQLTDGRWLVVVYRRLPGGARVALWTDITQLKQAEAERRDLQDQLHHSQRLDALGRLAGGVAHEINNALVPAIALTRRIASRLPEESGERRWLGMVQQGAERARDLVKSILAFSRRTEQSHEQVDLGAVLHDALGLMRATVPTSIQWSEEIAQTPPIAGDRNQLHQVLVNIITNAAQAIGETPGRITIGLAPADGSVRLWIADTGCGMDADTKERVFEPFFTTKDVGQGTGLGLSVAHGIIEDHGGSIAVDSERGRGTRFTITLPVPQAAASKAAE